MRRKKVPSDWRQWLATLPEEVRLAEPASLDAIRAVEREFRIELRDDLFGYPVSADGNARHRNDIFEWGHETDNRLEAAISLRSYIEGVIDGSIEV